MARSPEGLVAELRTLADLFEKHPEVAEEYLYSFSRYNLTVFPHGSKEDLEVALNRFITAGLDATRGTERRVEKDFDGNRAGAWFTLGEHVGLAVSLRRDEVCRKVELDETEEVEVVDPDYRPTPPPKVTVTRRKVEWVCGPMRRLDERSQLPPGADHVYDAELVEDELVDR